ncbi:ABC transporter ATP-binding protein [Novisyntrophococcus fermenticellae]|uniref:ABC transporter ATP-binding protein n=1 Tax=Novisyntrophococcus fermenticellae TaxID=2068655 RepID=UPI001E376D46|nr:ABC transporter ATP-binding protein [Novisyntrophococcus fermenticellae]
MIEVKNLVKRYGNHVAVNNLNFTIEEGKIYGLLGPNGAGKSTTMNMITGYLASTEGTITINGHDILTDSETAKKCIGYLPEQPPLYVDMTVFEYLKFVAELKKIPAQHREKQIDEIMELVKIRDMKNRLIKNLSKGYKQRVGLAQAVLGYPEIIILDEPTVGLDPKQMIEIRDLIKSLGEKHTVILSSHILSEVSAVCDYVMIISHGKLVASDTPENLSNHLVGSNTLEFTVKGDLGIIVSEFATIPNMENIKYSDSQEEGCVDVSLTTSKDVDLREIIFYKLAKLNIPIFKMQLYAMSLEDVFLELTEHDTEAIEHQIKDSDEIENDSEIENISELEDVELKEEKTE